jgi:glutathione synthase/RimK-type ligase-like ATP-grasp enzyme
MKIAIHHRPGSFSTRWIEYCEEKGITYKLVNCYDNDIIQQQDDCDSLMWHFHHALPKDVLFAKQLLYSLETVGKKVFPDFNTCWHFDDKVGQKYLLEAAGAPMVPSYVFYDKKDALKWAEKADFPKVFKLRRGSGSDHVKLVDDIGSAKNLIKKAFGEGFSQYDATANLRERWRKFRLGKTDLKDVVKGVARLGYTTDFAKVMGNEKGYIYFQDFISGNDHDIRVNVVNGRAFAVKRGVRVNDFRASGSGFPFFEKHHFKENVISDAFDIAEKLKMQSVAFDFLRHEEQYLISEISYGFCDMTRSCPGYWNRNLEWFEGPFYEEDWMIEQIQDRLKMPVELN